ncbi:MAG: hypothetical protein OXB96_01100 [Candidatus Kaiserbacteria bacterium]|nr:hypothetical protein [Candidatus Kaiserbacteria bacterium]
MPVTVENKNEKTSTVTITNGHLEALQEITNTLGTKGEAHTIAFLIEIIRDQRSKDIRINNVLYRPSDALLK